MKKITTLLMLVAGVLSITAQNVRATSNINDGFNINRKNTNGHQFLLDDWVIGYMVDNNGNLSEKKLLNYDIYNYNPTYKLGQNQKDILVIDRNLFSGFVLTDAENRQYIFSKINGDQFEDSKKEDVFYQLINAPKKNIILESTKKLKDPNASGWSSSRDNTLSAKFVLKTTAYVLDKNNKYVKVKFSSSSIANAFSDKKKEIKDFIKKQKLKIDDEYDLIPIVDYYYSLK